MRDIAAEERACINNVSRSYHHGAETVDGWKLDPILLYNS